MNLLNIDHKPVLPDGYRPKIGIVGVGHIVRNQHLLAYKNYGIKVGGVYDINPQSIQMAQEQYDIGTVYENLDDLLADPSIDIIDVGTHPEHRVEPVIKALEAGKHVLAQKPITLDVASARQLIETSKRTDKLLAVNQNGRFAPPWRIASLLVENGAIGDVFSVMHMFETHFGWVTGTVFDAVPHFLIYDYAIHFFDISRVWMGDKTVVAVRARDYRLPHQPSDSLGDWGAWSEISYTDGSNVMIRSIGGAKSAKDEHLFWIHGTGGTIAGSILHHEAVRLETNGTVVNYQTEGGWFPDGFAGAMIELINSVHEGRQPNHSAEHNLLSLQMTLAATLSADRDGAPVTLEEVL